MTKKTDFCRYMALCVTYFVLLFCIINTNTMAQNATNVVLHNKNGWELGAHYGRIITHTPIFLPSITESSSVFFLRHICQTNGSQLWHQYHHYPIVSWQGIYGRFGNRSVFGEGFGLVRSIGFVNRWDNFSLRYTLGSGLAYISRPYHRLNNTTNNVIGSHWNNYTTVQTSAVWQAANHWAVLGEGSLTHFSNARSQAPNLGINVAAAGVTLRYSFDTDIAPNQSATLPDLPPFVRSKWHIGMRLAYGQHAGETAWGPSFPIYVADVFVTKRWRPAWQFLAGVETNYYESIRWFVLNQVAFPSNQATAKALKVAPYLGVESFFGRFSLLLTTGFYAYNPFLQRQPLPAKLGVQYYFRPTYQHYGKQLLVGVYLRTHYANADYFSAGMGYIF